MKPIVASLLAGAVASGGLWLSDLAGLSQLRFGGVADASAQQRLVDAARGALIGFELRLLALHLAAGAVYGALAGLALAGLPSRWRLRGFRAALAAAGAVLAAAALALGGLVARYPQLVADRWWLGEGALARLQLAITHGAGPVPFDAGLLLLTAVLLALAARAHVPGWRLGGAAAAVVAVLGLGLALPVRPRGTATASPNVLVLAADSLRSDRLDDPEVMPFLASRIAGGAFYRNAFTPIARTYPSWISILTGRETAGHGVRHMFPTRAARAQLGATLFTELRDRDYFTFAVSDFSGDIFPGFEAGFEWLDTPHLTADTLARSSVLAGHTWTLPLLRLRAVRDALPVWRNLPSLADPEWVVDGLLEALDARAARGRRFAGVAFFSTAHFPYVAPHPYYLYGSDGYRGPYLYHAPPVPVRGEPSPADVTQVRHRYDAALRAIDTSLARLFEGLEDRGLAESTVVAVVGDHGEDLYEEDGLAGHGDVVSSPRAQAVPILLLGPGVPAGKSAADQVRLHDLAATLLDLVDPARPGAGDFGDGRTLLDEHALRPVCVETGIWFWPSRPPALRGARLEYDPISSLLEVDPESRELVLRPEREAEVETAKERGLVLGARMWRERMTPRGIAAGLVDLEGVAPSPDAAALDLSALFEERCVARDPALVRFLGGVIYQRPGGESGGSH